MKKTKLYKNAATTSDEQSIKIRKCDVGAIVIKKATRTQRALQIASLIFSILFISLIVFFFTDECATHSSGDFKFQYDSFSGYKRRVAVITGLTKQGRQKEILVIPESINGYDVVGLRKRALIEWDNPYIEIESNNLTILYLHYSMFRYAGMKCPNLKKVFVIKVNERVATPFQTLAEKLYIYAQPYFLNYEANREIQACPANVTYYYNYEGASNYGCYWLDNLDNGEKITYIPNKPQRKGYKFVGWYHEPECITEWDFDNDTVKSSGEEGYTDRGKFIENKLYAKWMEN